MVDLLMIEMLFCLLDLFLELFGMMCCVVLCCAKLDLFVFALLFDDYFNVDKERFTIGDPSGLDSISQLYNHGASSRSSQVQFDNVATKITNLHHQ